MATIDRPNSSFNKASSFDNINHDWLVEGDDASVDGHPSLQ
jgi:hypothetical protein